jgi:hypothetical protein
MCKSIIQTIVSTVGIAIIINAFITTGKSAFANDYDELANELNLLVNMIHSDNYIEIGENTCYVKSNSGIIYDGGLLTVNKFTFTIFTPMRGIRNVNLEKKENSGLLTICHEYMKIIYKGMSLKIKMNNEIREIRENLYRQKPVQNPDIFQLNIQNNWDLFLKE